MNKFFVFAFCIISIFFLNGLSTSDLSANENIPTQNYEFTYLGNLGGLGDNDAAAINNNTQITGRTNVRAYNHPGFIWENGVMTSLGSLSSTIRTIGWDINDLGQIAGESSLGSLDGSWNGHVHAILWENGILNDLGTVGGRQCSWASGINDSGYIVGRSYDRSGGRINNVGFVYYDGQMTELTPHEVFSMSQSIASRINNHGHIIGRCYDYLDKKTYPNKAYILKDGLTIDLGHLGGEFNQPFDINDVAQVVGYSTLVPGSEIHHAYLWENNNIIDLGTLGGSRSRASAINNHGQIVGRATTAAEVWHPVLWDNNQIFDFWDIIVANIGFNISSFSFSDINDSGEIIGTASDFNGGSYMFLLSPIQAENIAPEANAGDDQTAHVSHLITLDGSASDDLDENFPLTYAWEVSSAPTGSTATITDADAVLASFSPDVVGDYAIQLIVTDNLNLASNPDEVIISTTNSAPLANAGNDQAIVEIGTVVTLDGTQSEDSDDDPLTFSWQLTLPDGSSTTLDDATSPTPSFIADVHADFTAQLIVSDGWAYSEPDSVLVSFSNVAPIADAGGNQSVVIGDTVYLNGSGTDANYDPLNVGWAIVSAPEGSLATLNSYQDANTSFTPDLTGDYVLNLLAYDGFEYSAPSNMTVTVISKQTAITDLLQDGIVVINNFDNDVLFKNNKADQLTNTINQILKKIDADDYEQALHHVEQVLIRLDGCALRGEPDTTVPQNERDWVTTCEAQAIVYPQVKEAYDYLASLVDGN